MAALVVDPLQVVAVDENERELAAGAFGPVQLLAEALLEAAPVEEAREQIGDRGAVFFL